MAIYQITTANSVKTSDDMQHAFAGDTPVADRLIVDAHAYLWATGLNAFGANLGNGMAWTVQVNGGVRSEDSVAIFLDNVFGADSGLSVGTGGVIYGTIRRPSTIEVGKTGWVLGAYYGMRIDSPATINNAGQIEGGEVGILLSEAGKHTVRNTGYVLGGDFGIRDINGVSDNSVTNSRQIDGNVLLAGGADALTNSGAINGDVNMGSGDNSVTNSKSIAGVVNLGLGHDKLTNSGLIGDVVFAGDGNDMIKNSGTLADDVMLGSGLNNLTNTGRIGDDVVGEFEKDVGEEHRRDRGAGEPRRRRRHSYRRQPSGNRRRRRRFGYRQAWRRRGQLLRDTPHRRGRHRHDRRRRRL